MAFARHEFRMREPMDDGNSRREHLLAAAWRSEVSEELDGPPCPALVAHVWDWYCELSASRRDGGSIGPADAEAWFHMNGVEPLPVELGLLRALDVEFLRFREKRAHARGPGR